MEIDQIAVLIRLIIAHLVADFLLQSNTMVAEKKQGLRSRYFYYHILIVGLITYLFLAQWQNWLAPLIIMIAHGAIDATKASITSRVKWAAAKAKWIFIADQLLHLLTLLAYWIWAGDVLKDVAFSRLFNASILQNVDLLLILAAYLVVTMPFGVLIGHLTRKWQEEIKKEDQKRESMGAGLNSTTDESLRDAGRTIGMIERSLVLTLILIQQYQAIGFLIAAKSVFRFGDLKEPGQRKRTEYILIGTLISFFLSMLVGLGTHYLLEKL